MFRNSLSKTSMRTLALLFMTFAAIAAVAQAPSSQPPATMPAPAMSAALAADLDRLQMAATQINADISRMRIEKWKVDSGSKQQAQANGESIQRNLTTALPGLIANYRTQPQDLNAGFKLYRNLNALYDVMTSFTESAGAFGPKNDYDALAEQLNVIDTARHDLADNLEGQTSRTQAELNQLRQQVRQLQQAAVPPPPPKKTVVDNAEPAKKTTHKKKSTTTSSSTSGSTTGGSATTPSTAKPQQ